MLEDSAYPGVIGRKIATHHKGFSPAYRMSVFSLWYELGKPGFRILYEAIKPDEHGDLPTKTTLESWVKDEFLAQGEALDRQLQEAMSQRLIQEKIKMLDEHTATAQKMQKMAVDYLDDHKDDLKVPNAVRLLVEGIRIERESRGIPAMLEKISDQSTDELLNQLKDIMSKAPVSIEAVTDGDYSDAV